MKRFLWFALWLATAGGAFAQEADPYAGQKAQIREIKLSNEYYYSDVSSEDPEETRGMARQLLVLAIQQEETDAMGVDTLVADSCRFIELKRIDQPRFFAYISKEAVAVWLYRKHHPGEPLPQLAALLPYRQHRWRKSRQIRRLPLRRTRRWLLCPKRRRTACRMESQCLWLR